MNPCAHTDQLDAYLDGDLAPAETRAFEAHAGACPACAAELALARRLQGALRALPAEPCPYEVFQGALDRIARESKDRPALPSPARARRPRWHAAGVGVGLVALVALALVLARPANEPAPVEPVASTETPDPTPPAVDLPAAEPVPAGAGDTTATPSPARPETTPTARRRAPRPAPYTAPKGDLAAARPTPSPAPEPSAEPTPAEVASAREGVRLAFTLFAEANRQATEAVRSNVGQQLEHVTDALALTLPR